MVRWFIDRSPQPARPSINLRRLLPDAAISGSQDWSVTGCTVDLQTLRPGEVFVAVGGDHQTNDEFIDQALARGASGVVVERRSARAGRRQAIVPDARAAYARLCHALVGNPADRLDVIGVTGTRKAATLSLLLRSIFNHARERFGIVGPQVWSDGVASLPADVGLLDSESLADKLSSMIRHQCVGGIVEFSAGLLAATDIVTGVDFAAAVIPSVKETSSDSRDALNARRRAYAKLVRRVRPGGTVVVDEDDPDSELLGAANLDAERVSIGIDRPADLVAEVISADDRRSVFRLRGLGLDHVVRLRMGGLDSIRLALGAAAVARSRGATPSAIVAGLEGIDGPSGGSETVDEGQAFQVRVAGPNSPDELAESLRALRSVCSGRIFCVIGAEGLGRTEDRLELARTVESASDVVVLTSDNPRTEDPHAIIADLRAGLGSETEVLIEPDRRRAIEAAIGRLGPGDGLLIAGKGRHGFQVLADRAVPFDDRAVASQVIRSIQAANR